MFVPPKSLFLLVVVASVVGLSHGVGVKRAPQNCQTIKTGTFQSFEDKEVFLTLNANKELTLGDGDTFQAAFQSCPALGHFDTEFNSYGRVAILPLSSNQCLTVKSSSEPTTLQVTTCSSDTTPSAAQQFGFGNDFGDVIFATGFCEGGAGLLLNGEKLALDSEKRVQLICDLPKFGSDESMGLDASGDDGTTAATSSSTSASTVHSSSKTTKSTTTTTTLKPSTSTTITGTTSTTIFSTTTIASASGSALSSGSVSFLSSPTPTGPSGSVSSPLAGSSSVVESTPAPTSGASSFGTSLSVVVASILVAMLAF